MSLWTRSHQLPHKDPDTDTEAPLQKQKQEQEQEQDPPPDDTGTESGTGTGTGTESDTSAPARPGAVQILAYTVTALAAALVLCALLLPNRTDLLTPGAFARIPVEAIFGAALLLVLPPRPRLIASVVGGLVLGVLTLMSLLDMGFYTFLDRPFDPVLDWILFGDAKSFLDDSIGRVGAMGVTIGVIVLALALPALLTLAVVRLGRIMARHSAVATRSTLVLGTVWLVCASLGAQVAGVPLASSSAADHIDTSATLVADGIKDRRVFAEEARVDAFSGKPPGQLLTGLRGKDVIFAFIESYGRSAIDDPAMAPQIEAVLERGTRQLDRAGFSARSGYLTSPVSGAGSWLAHTTFMSGMWVKNQQRYRSVTSSDRLTLTDAFRRTGDWRTVGIMPGVTRSWPEGKFFGLDHIYDSRQMGYQGPKFSWSPVPDQFSLEAFQRLEHGKPDHEPLMAEIILATSHNPWAPLPEMVDWDEIGDGSIYHDIKKAGKDPKEVWTDSAKVRNEYRHAIEYSVHSLVSYLEKYGDDDTVLVFLGDHQPNTTVTGTDAGRDVPISIVARDPAVLDRIDGWNWDDGLMPGKDAPVWRMDRFRDRFLTAYGPTGGAR
ncbi:sulfatase [Streptomyces sp. NPDC091212]|uniref:sulfatase n=1 Tax=Streptomyces sp. NPDC091212 TaxID=3155191 RepID=UPI0034177F19